MDHRYDGIRGGMNVLVGRRVVSAGYRVPGSAGWVGLRGEVKMLGWWGCCKEGSG